jgi:hypothetical protein
VTDFHSSQVFVFLYGPHSTKLQEKIVGQKPHTPVGATLFYATEKREIQKSPERQTTQQHPHNTLQVQAWCKLLRNRGGSPTHVGVEIS